MAAIAAAVIAALGTAYSADQQNSSSLMAQAKKNQPGGPAGGGYEPVATKFSPGVSGTGDGSMPVKANPEQAASPAAGPASTVFSPNPSESISSGPVANAAAPPAQPTQPPPEQPQQTQGTDWASLAQTGVSLGQALQGPQVQASPVNQPGPGGYQPTALQALQMLLQRKRQGY